VFWNRKTKNVEDKVALPIARSTSTADNGLSRYSDLELRRAILDWRDRHIEAIESHFEREIPALFGVLDQQLDKMSFTELFKQRKFAKEKIEPIYGDWINREVTSVGQAARKDLAQIVSHAVEMGQFGHKLEDVASKSPVADAAIIAAATGIGLAAIPAFATMSIVSAGGILGFLGVTTVAWPIAAIGIAVVGGLMALGGYKAARLKSRAIERYRKGMHEAIRSRVLGSSDNEESICRLLQSKIDTRADTILKEIDNC
jgi:hypothetical protein